MIASIKKIFLILLGLIWLILFVGCEKASDSDKIIMKKDRILSIAITEGKNNDFMHVFNLVIKAGADRPGEIDAQWNKFETEPEKYTDPFLYGGNKFYAKQKMPVALTISPVETNHDLPPSSVQDIFRNLVHHFPDKPIYLMQWGYPSGEKNASSYELQRQFIVETFRAWDRYADNIKLITFTWLHDLSPLETKQITDAYGLNDHSFVEFLSTLGIRTYQGKPKPSYNTLVKEAKKRGW